MALYSSVLRRKQSPMQTDLAKAATFGAQSSGQPAPAPIAMGGGAPASLSGARPRLPGNVAPAPLPQRDVTRADVGMRPVAPPSATAPAPGTLPGAPPRPAPPAPPPDVTGPIGKGMDTTGGGGTSQDDIDQMIRDMVAERLRGAGKADTAEEEALIRQQMAQAAGGSSVNARARAGAAGMASSGALQAQEGDIRRAAEMDALDQVLGLRRTEDQRSIENAMGAVNAEQGMRRAASDDALRRMALEALQAEMGLDAGETGGGDLAAPITDALGVETEAPATASAGGKQAPSIKNGMDEANAIPVSGPPAGATRTANGFWYDSATRKYYEVV